MRYYIREASPRSTNVVAVYRETPTAWEWWNPTTQTWETSAAIADRMERARWLGDMLISEVPETIALEYARQLVAIPSPV